MTFLQQLKEKRLTLQATQTIVTTATGERYIENHVGDHITLCKLNKQAYGFIVDTKPDTKPSCILDGFLYLGSQDAVVSDNIIFYKITHILSVGIDTPKHGCEEIVKQKFVPCLDIPETRLFDSNGIIEEACSFIEMCRYHNGRVLVHCNAGVSRSPTVVIAYLLLHSGMTFNAALTSVKAKRSTIQPNAGFLKQLQIYKP